MMEAFLAGEEEEEAEVSSLESFLSSLEQATSINGALMHHRSSPKRGAVSSACFRCGGALGGSVSGVRSRAGFSVSQSAMTRRREGGGDPKLMGIHDPNGRQKKYITKPGLNGPL